MKSRDIAIVAIYAALYSAMVVVFAPFSFSALQFRVAGILRPGIARKRELAFGYAVGTVVANIFSPFSGIYELFFMPIMSLIAGLVGYEVANRMKTNYYACGILIAVIIPVSVAWMLNQLFNLPIITTLPGLVVSEQIINLIGSFIFKTLETRYEWWK